MREAWVLSILEQCEKANVPFFFKQWGGVRKQATGRTLLGRTHDGIPERVQHPTLPAWLRLRHASEVESGTLVQRIRRSQTTPRPVTCKRSAQNCTWLFSRALLAHGHRYQQRPDLPQGAALASVPVIY